MLAFREITCPSYWVEGKLFLWNTEAVLLVLWKMLNSFTERKQFAGTNIKMTCTVTMAPFSCEDEENLGREQCSHRGHKLCFSLPRKAKYIFIFLPSAFAFSFSKIWVKHCLVKKEESLPVVKLPFHPWQLGSHELKQIFFFLSGDCFWSEHCVWL